MTRFTYNDENKRRIQLVADRLNGTCGSLDSALQDEFGEDVELLDFDQQLLEELDDITMECEGCGWWVDAGEIDDGMCQECTAE